MTEPHEIWQLARWIGRQEGGAASLGWSQGEVIMRVAGGRVLWVEGIDPSELCRRLSCRSDSGNDLLEVARGLASSGQISENYAMGAAKELLQQRLRAWLLDPERRLELVDGEPDEVEGATISLTHLLVELVLSDTAGNTASAILPDDDVLLSRSPRFLDLYAPLRLSEEADVIVSKITGERSAREIAQRSDHGSDEVTRLLAALVVTGILEPEPALVVREDLELLPEAEPAESPRRRLPVRWILIAAAVLVLALAVIAWIVGRSGGENGDGAAAAADAPQGHHWALVVDMGCEPQDLQRVLKKAQQNPKALRPVSVNSDGGSPCWQLVWGRFSSQRAADQAIRDLPAAFRETGFEPHAVELTGEEDVPQSPSDG